MKRKWKKFDTAFRSTRDAFAEFLADSNICYTLGGEPANWKFRVFCDSLEEKKLNEWIMKNSAVNEERITA